MRLIGYANGELVVVKRPDPIRRSVLVGAGDPLVNSSTAVDVKFLEESTGQWVVLGCRRPEVAVAPNLGGYVLSVHAVAKTAHFEPDQ